MLRYAITNRKLILAETDPVRLLADQARRWSATGVDWIQLREKDLPAGELEQIARAMLQTLHQPGIQTGSKTRLLINSRLDVAIATGADGVHLTAQPGELTVQQVKQIWPTGTVSISCHSAEEVRRASQSGADLIVFGPVFEKPVELGETVPGVGLAHLREACEIARKTPVLALGGVTEANAADCLAAGAAGIAGIRLFLAT